VKTRMMHVPICLMALTLLAFAGAPATARAGLDIDFGAAVQIGDEADIYVAVSSRYFDQDAGNTRRWNRQCADPDDLAVALFLARHGRTSPDQVFALRSRGLSWWEISLRLGVPADIWFVPVQGDPGPPYGRAYGHWRKRGRQSPRELDLNDGDARNLVAVRLLHEYYGVSVEIAMQWRSSGRDLRTIAVGEYRDRHGQGRLASAGMGSGPAGHDAQSDKKGGKNAGKNGGNGTGRK